MTSNGVSNSEKDAQKTSKLSDQEMIYLRRKFDEIDVNHDGGISKEELVTLLTTIGYKSKDSIDADAQTLIEEMDLDKSNTVNFFEFAKGFEQLQLDIKLEDERGTQTNGQTQFSAKKMLVNELRKALQTTANLDNSNQVIEAQKKTKSLKLELQESQRELQDAKEKLSGQKNSTIPDEIKLKLKQQLTDTLRNTQKQIEDLQHTKKDYLFQLSELEKKFMDSQLNWHQVEKRVKVLQVASEPPREDSGPPMSVSENVSYGLGVGVMIAGFLVWLFIFSQVLEDMITN